MVRFEPVIPEMPVDKQQAIGAKRSKRGYIMGLTYGGAASYWISAS